ncbi:MAG: hypothetical protein ACOYBX_15830, partial [Mycobacterium sp.]
PAGEPKPAKPAKVKKPRGKRKPAASDTAASDTAVETAETGADGTVEVVEVVEAELEPSSEITDESELTAEDPAATGGLRNKRPMGKSRNRLRR